MIRLILSYICTYIIFKKIIYKEYLKNLKRKINYLNKKGQNNQNLINSYIVHWVFMYVVVVTLLILLIVIH